MGKKSRTKRQRRSEQPNILQPPPEIAAAIDGTSNEDRLWFEANPLAAYRTRPPVPGEFWPTFDAACVAYVIVHQVRPGFRLRVPILRLYPPKTERVQ